MNTIIAAYLSAILAINGAEQVQVRYSTPKDATLIVWVQCDRDGDFVPHIVQPVAADSKGVLVLNTRGVYAIRVSGVKDHTLVRIKREVVG